MAVQIAIHRATGLRYLLDLKRAVAHGPLTLEEAQELLEQALAEGNNLKGWTVDRRVKDWRDWRREMKAFISTTLNAYRWSVFSGEKRLGDGSVPTLEEAYEAIQAVVGHQTYGMTFDRWIPTVDGSGAKRYKVIMEKW
jgi:hypothetical protein